MTISRFAFASALLISLSSFCATDGQALFPLIVSYNTKKITLSVLERKYQDITETSPENQRLREAREADFFNSFKSSFMEMDKWLLASLCNNNPEENILKSVISHHKFHYQKVSDFLKEVEVIFDRMNAMHITYCMLKRDKNCVDDASSLRNTGFENISTIKPETLYYLKNIAWKSQFIEDVDEFIATKGASGNLANDIQKLLNDKFPFRTWVVLTTATSSDSQMCSRVERKLERQLAGGRTLMVLHKMSSEAFSVSKAAEAVARVPKESVKLYCKSQAVTIFNELKLSCAGKDSFKFVGVFPLSDDRSKTSVGAPSHPPTVRTGRVLRSFWIFCRKYYQIVIFG